MSCRLLFYMILNHKSSTAIICDDCFSIVFNMDYNNFITNTKIFKIAKVINIEIILFTNPSARAGYDTRSIFKRSLTGFNSEFSFS